MRAWLFNILFIAACSYTPMQQDAAADHMAVTTQADSDTTPSAPFQGNPLLSFSEHLDSIGLAPIHQLDSNYQYFGLERSRPSNWVDGRPWYASYPGLLAAFDESSLSPEHKKEVLHWDDCIARFANLWVDPRLFPKRSDIVLYAYGKPSNGDTLLCGVIEQWHFRSELDAIRADSSFKQRYQIPLLSEGPFRLRQGKYIFVFHSRIGSLEEERKLPFSLFLQMLSKNQLNFPDT